MTSSRSPAPSPPRPREGAPVTEDLAGTEHGAEDLARTDDLEGTEDSRDAAHEEIVRRLRSVEGHVRGVERMVGDGAYCIDVVNQILAVQRALKKVSGLVLDRHLHTCVTSAIRSESPEERERVIDEILDVFEATGRA